MKSWLLFKSELHGLGFDRGKLTCFGPNNERKQPKLKIKINNFQEGRNIGSKRELDKQNNLISAEMR